MALATIGIALFMAVIYTILGIAKSTGEEFNPVKATATILLGLFIGIVMYVSGTPITNANVMEQLGVYAGLLYVIENILKSFWRRVVMR